MEKLISIDIKADFGFFRKPDANNTINLSYNMLHKPALLGILGAIIGLEGYKELGKKPEYLNKLKELKVGVEPLNHEKGNFQKTVIKYSNTIGYANKGTNYLTEEATLIKPSYRAYILLDMANTDHSKLYNYLKDGKAEFLPYFGKNEFYAWWESWEDIFKEYEYEQAHQAENSFSVKTLLQKTGKPLKDQKEDSMFDFMNFDREEATYVYFERLPIGFDENLNQYKLGDFAYTNFKLRSNTQLENLYWIKKENFYVQLH
jgi:CRISPR-associated protein Cas5h